MKVLNNEEMMNIEGGSLTISEIGLIVGVGVGIMTFFTGVFDGLMDPNSCRNSKIKVNIDAR